MSLTSVMAIPTLTIPGYQDEATEKAETKMQLSTLAQQESAPKPFDDPIMTQSAAETNENVQSVSQAKVVANALLKFHLT